jgi:hypothetical protein
MQSSTERGEVPTGAAASNDEPPSDMQLLDLALQEPPLFSISEDQLSKLRATQSRAHKDITRILSEEQRQNLRRALASPRTPVTSQAVAEAVKAVLKETLKDQKLVELETAGLVAERLMSWAKLFAGAVAVPAGLLIAVLTIIGVSKYSDFTTLVSQSEEKLKSTVTQATANADLLGQKVADISQKQLQTDRDVSSLSKELSSVKERLGFAPGSDILIETQKHLQDLFLKFQAYLVGLGYSPGSQMISIKLLESGNAAGSIAYYSDNTIFIAKEAATDPSVIYREYLHHALYSQIGVDGIGPQRSALESGLADYLVASYLNNPRPYQGIGSDTNLVDSGRFHPAAGQQDRFPVGALWAGMFWQVRQTMQQHASADKLLYSSWFDLPKSLDDNSLPAEMILKFLHQQELVRDAGTKSQIVKILTDRGFPVPKEP